MLAVEDIREGMAGLLLSAEAPDGLCFGRAIIDSRQAGPGDLFFALRGEQQDGHDFVGQALASGARGAVVERPFPSQGSAAIFLVSDSLSALQSLAAHWRSKHRIRVVGVTGSVGKTTCKELVAAVLSRRFVTLKSEGNLNTEIGVPLTLLGLRPDHQRAVLEFGMYGPGEIRLLAQIARPDIGVVTNIGPVHLERLGSIEAIEDAKAELVEALAGESLAALNADDPRVRSFTTRTAARIMLYGRSMDAEVRGMDVTGHGLGGISFRLSYAGESVLVSCPLPGKHYVYPCLAAAAVGIAEGLSLSEIAAALSEARPDLRMRVVAGVNGSTIIDDSYNASPASMLAALDLLSELPGRRIALLGEMRELGAAEEEGHRLVGEQAARVCDLLLVAGERARPLAEAARMGLSAVRWLPSGDEAVDILRKELRSGDHLLIKASRALALERVVEGLAAR